MVNPIIVAVAVLDAFGILFLGSAILTGRLHRANILSRLATASALIGLSAQFARCVQHIVTGISPPDAAMPLWAFKDGALVLFAIGMLAHWRAKSKKSGEPVHLHRLDQDTPA